ncbi:c6 transcription factor [Stemphylium lycopersici]|nr:c6 transcription factor [Stemphylium lycopersici]
MIPTPSSTVSGAHSGAKISDEGHEGAETNSCFYGTSPGTRGDDESGRRANVSEMQIQIDRLESLVLCLVQGSANVGMFSSADRLPQSTDVYFGDKVALRSAEIDDDNSSLARSVGVLNLDSGGGKSMYVGQEHWDTILSDIVEVKAFFASHKKDLEKSYEKVTPSEPARARDCPVLLLGCTPATDTELRAGLPAQSVVLALCSRYFDWEMRRRTWALTRLADIMFSHLVSLPNTINSHECDTEFPSNIYDEEFGPKSDVLPPSHPTNEPTPISYMITKVRLYVKMSEIIQATNRVGGQVSYNDILEMDNQICHLYAAIPPHLQGTVLQVPFESVTTIIARFNISSLCQKIVCLLHKNYMLHAQQNNQYSHSRRRAVEAASQTLRHLVFLHHESEPGRTLESHPRFVHSIATKDFLLCAMLIALDLHHDQMEAASSPAIATKTRLFWTTEQRAEMMDTLETIKNIWKELASAEASKASKVLEIMLKKLKSQNCTSTRGASSNHSKSSNSRGNLQAALNMDIPSHGLEFNAATATEIAEPFDTFRHQDNSNAMANVGMMPNIYMNENENIRSEPAFSMFKDCELGDESLGNLNWVSLKSNLRYALLKAT